MDEIRFKGNIRDKALRLLPKSLIHHQGAVLQTLQNLEPPFLVFECSLQNESWLDWGFGYECTAQKHFSHFALGFDHQSQIPNLFFYTDKVPSPQKQDLKRLWDELKLPAPLELINYCQQEEFSLAHLGLLFARGKTIRLAFKKKDLRINSLFSHLTKLASLHIDPTPFLTLDPYISHCFFGLDVNQKIEDRVGVKCHIQSEQWVDTLNRLCELKWASPERVEELLKWRGGVLFSEEHILMRKSLTDIKFIFKSNQLVETKIYLTIDCIT
jgi:hypothetical protein